MLLPDINLPYNHSHLYHYNPCCILWRT